MNTNTIYLLRTREFIQLNQPVYKMGRTDQPLEKRMKGYPKGSQLLYSDICCHTVNTETIILRYFKTQFIHRKDIGKEYFEGDPNKMIEIISHFCKNYIDFSNINIQDCMIDVDEHPIKKSPKKRIVSKQKIIETAINTIDDDSMSDD